MSNRYRPILLNEITDDVVIEILHGVIPVFNQLSVSYFVVGAFARDVEFFAKGHTGPPSRKTKDLDLAVMVADEKEFNRIKSVLLSLDGFTAHALEPYRLLFKESYELDLLPFGKIEDEKGDVYLKAKRTIVLNMPGFSEAHLAVETVKTDQGFELKVSSLPGVVLLKLIAWDDRPAERSKDIQDIEYIFRNLYLLEVEEIVANDSDLLDLLEGEENYSECVSARYIGRKIGVMIRETETLLNRVRRILLKNTESESTSAMAKIIAYETQEEAIRIIRQLYLGIEDVTG